MVAICWTTSIELTLQVDRKDVCQNETNGGLGFAVASALTRTLIPFHAMKAHQGRSCCHNADLRGKHDEQLKLIC